MSTQTITLDQFITEQQLVRGAHNIRRGRGIHITRKQTTAYQVRCGDKNQAIKLPSWAGNHFKQ